MKKIILGLIIVIGLLSLASYAIVASHRRINLNQLSFRRLTTQTIPVTKFKRLNLQLRTAKVIVKPGSKNQITCQNVAANELKITQVAGNVAIRQDLAGQHQLEIGHTPVITITVAHPQALTINGQLLNGTLDLAHLKLQQLQFKHTNGTTHLKDVALTRGGYLRKQNGATTLQNLRTDGLNIQLKNGQVKTNGKSHGQHFQQAGQYPFTITNRNGQVQLTTD